jgi:mannonate dehydratase
MADLAVSPSWSLRAFGVAKSERTTAPFSRMLPTDDADRPKENTAVAQPTIRDVRVILTSPGTGDVQKRLIVVKVETTEPGLYGLGCATFTQRPDSVRSAVADGLRPLLIGRDPQRIEELWHLMHVNAYWRSGPVLNNAMSGVDEALWDLKGKIAGLPVYQLLGGKCREGAAIYRHAAGRDEAEVLERVRAFLAAGVRHVRAQIGGYGGQARPDPAVAAAFPGAYFDPADYTRRTRTLFERLRAELGDEPELLHDVHERLPPSDAVRFAKDLERYRLFYLEDLLPPEQIQWFARTREVCATPLAMGELFTHPAEWMPLIEGRQIDFIRCHISAIGGITPARKLAAVCEAFGIRTAWHGPGDVSPVGHAANVHLDLATRNFGVQEWAGFSEIEREIFPGCPETRGGFVYASDLPGLGVDIREDLARKYPCPEGVIDWTQARTLDGAGAYP